MIFLWLIKLLLSKILKETSKDTRFNKIIKITIAKAKVFSLKDRFPSKNLPRFSLFFPTSINIANPKRYEIEVNCFVLFAPNLYIKGISIKEINSDATIKIDINKTKPKFSIFTFKKNINARLIRRDTKVISQRKTY